MHKKLVVLACYLAATLVVSTTTAQADIVKFFEFDGALPSTDPDIELFTAGASATETEVYSVSGGLLQQRTFNNDGNYSYSFPDVTLKGGGLDPAKSLVMEARLRILDIEGIDGAFFEAFDGANRYGPLFEETGFVFFDAQRRGPSIDLSHLDLSQFHTYRVESPGGSSSFTFSVDGLIVFSGNAAGASGFNGFEWGDGFSSAGNGADVDWDFVHFAQPIPPAPVMSDSFRCFKVSTEKLVPTPIVELEDEFTVGVVDVVDVRKAKSICVPVDVDGQGIADPSTAFTCYSTKPEKNVDLAIEVTNPFGDDQPMVITMGNTVCVPSSFVFVEP